MHRVLSRHGKILLAIGALSLAAVVIVGVTYVRTETEQTAIEADSDRLTLLRRLTEQLSGAVLSQESAVDDYVLLRDPSSVVQFEEYVSEEGQLISRIDSAASDLSDVQSATSSLKALTEAWRSTFARPVIAAAKAGSASDLERLTRLTVDDNEPLKAAIHRISGALDDVQLELRERDAALAGTRVVATIFGLGVMILTSALAMWLIRRYGRTLEDDARRAGILNRFTEVTSFASDDQSVAASNLVALALLVRPSAGVTHVLNRSKDRAIPEATIGDAEASILPLNALARCPGVMRASMYVTSDVAEPLSVHCPVYPIQRGTLACVPLISGESVGAVHLYWERPHGLPLELRSSVVRIAEHAALAIANWRLLAALQGQADTDPRTGLANSRAFDKALEEALAARRPEEAVAVLMLDLDNFKDFNDRHGHPAGDEALRAFAGVLRSCMREGDVAARYGGEEFAILLPRVDSAAALAISERIRARTESTIISLAPGITDRITVSIGAAAAPDHGLERVALLRVADDALYRAKSAGRNRVELGSDWQDGTSAPASVPA
jgi:diguanylate cyclase (GGDEF)-like protein